MGAVVVKLNVPQLVEQATMLAAVTVTVVAFEETTT
jgi:hypothetical protein